MGYSTYSGHVGDCSSCKRDACVLTGKEKEGGMSAQEQEVLLPMDVVLAERERAPGLLTKEVAMEEEEELKKPTINEADWDARGLLMPPEVREAMHRQKRQMKSKTKQEPDKSGPDGGVLLPIEFRRR